MINNKTYGMPEEPKDRPIFEYTSRTNSRQIVTHLTIMIECASHLYFTTHKLEPFCDHFDLGKQMRAHVNFFVKNQDSDTSQILDVKIEGNKLSTLPIQITSPTILLPKMLCMTFMRLCQQAANLNAPKHRTNLFAAKKLLPQQHQS
ncbi:uncharacterized protein UBRO_20742 [Ustilago bromivora]|uniref:Uncharacterized protein n=1 Tax=Ustilago bromivora TaxID=307758 RepID=A0A1K0H688_9BASI|nr:uncharacterized protein UBRO_20742 [Ustilago bromivora]